MDKAIAASPSPPGITPDVKGLRDEIKEMRNDYNHSISYWENHEEGMANLYLAKRETLDKVLEIIDSLPVAEPKGVCTCGFSTEYQHDITGKCRRCHKWILHHLIALAESPEPKGLTPEDVDEIADILFLDSMDDDSEGASAYVDGITNLQNAIKSRLSQTEEEHD